MEGLGELFEEKKNVCVCVTSSDIFLKPLLLI